jgi:hypothetical protein
VLCSPEILYDDLLYVAVLLVQLPQQQQVSQPLLPGLTKAYQQTCSRTQQANPPHEITNQTYGQHQHQQEEQ